MRDDDARRLLPPWRLCNPMGDSDELDCQRDTGWTVQWYCAHTGTADVPPAEPCSSHAMALGNAVHMQATPSVRAGVADAQAQ